MWKTLLDDLKKPWTARRITGAAMILSVLLLILGALIFAYGFVPTLVILVVSFSIVAVLVGGLSMVFD